MKASLVSLLVLLFINAQCYQDILGQLIADRTYNRKSIIESLLSELKPELKEQKAMDLDIVIDFVRRHLTLQETPFQQVKQKFASLFSEFKNEWVFDMISKTIRAIGIDMDNVELIERIRENPEAYSINYNTYRILTNTY